jgi:hypothetical protein
MEQWLIEAEFQWAMSAKRYFQSSVHCAASVIMGSQLPLAASCTNDRFAKVSVVTF